MDEKSYKKNLIYYIGYVTIKDSKCGKINSVNPLYLIINKVNGNVGDINKSKYLFLFLMNAKKKLKTMKNCEVKPEI